MDAEALKSDLEELGIKNKAFTKVIGISPSHLSFLLNNRRCPSAPLERNIELFIKDLKEVYEKHRCK